MNSNKTSRIRHLKLCCGVSAILLIIVVVVLTTLSLTIFKPRQPEITAHPHLVFNPGSLSQQLNITIQMVITIDNPNYESFRFKNTTAYVTYREDVVAEVPIVQQHVPGHAKLNVTTSADLMVSKLISNPYFWNDVAAGCLNLNSKSTLHGHVSLLKFFKLHFKALSSCDISFFISLRNVESRCNTKIKL
ncbi:hypothetical protein FNV43_RR13402 [Rhamnella rubrinervis]|uniref:Late embryogenesis abundant protein LEA-2 subgroup domain-containing protein n=1 Tax=Rhamnella rubrinervis TaxID=2594499 RepID=A0A8K0H115_9ROSA|nr:hypothetical protein FNV43_RR13402 [Rhamnella rubrinervis]